MHPVAPGGYSPGSSSCRFGQGVVMCKPPLFAALLITLAVANASAQDKETLRGIAGVRVSVAVAGEGAKQDGLSEAALRAVLEEKVRGAGLRLSIDEKAPAL